MAAGETFRLYVVCVLEREGEDHTHDLMRMDSLLEQLPGYDDCAVAQWSGPLLELATRRKRDTDEPA